MLEVDPAALTAAAAAVRVAASDVVAVPAGPPTGSARLDDAVQRFARTSAVRAATLADDLRADAEALVAAATEYVRVDGTAVAP